MSNDTKSTATHAEIETERQRQAAFDATRAQRSSAELAAEDAKRAAFGPLSSTAQRPTQTNPNLSNQNPLNPRQSSTPAPNVETPASERARHQRIADQNRTPAQRQEEGERIAAEKAGVARMQADPCANMVVAEINQLIAEINNTPTGGLNPQITEAVIERLQFIRDGAQGNENWHNTNRRKQLPGQIDLTIPHRPSVGEYDPDNAYLEPTQNDPGSNRSVDPNAKIGKTPAGQQPTRVGTQPAI